MTELRWTLLGLGALFVLGLLLWERFKRGRGASGKGSGSYRAASPGDNVRDAAADSEADYAAQRRQAREMRREPPQDLPVFDIDEAEASAARAAPSAQVGEYGDVISVPTDSAGVMRGMRVESMVGTADAAGRAEQWIAAAGVRSLRAEDLILDWPPDDQRSIVALRMEARGTERLGGRSVRQSLLGEGFVFGARDIFHLALADGRVIVSAASLTKPGSFSLATIDAQTFVGLNLFAVLPGPLSGAETLERLVASGRLLAQRLRADLLDTQGQPLTESRLTEMRSRLAGIAAVEPKGAAPAAAAGGDKV